MPPEDHFNHDCCIKCAHWYHEFCYRYPPTPSWNEASGRDRFARYPAVAPANWCGEFKAETKQTLQERIDWIREERNSDV